MIMGPPVRAILTTSLILLTHLSKSTCWPFYIPNKLTFLFTLTCHPTYLTKFLTYLPSCLTYPHDLRYLPTYLLTYQPTYLTHALNKYTAIQPTYQPTYLSTNEPTKLTYLTTVGARCTPTSRLLSATAATSSRTPSSSSLQEQPKHWWCFC